MPVINMGGPAPTGGVKIPSKNAWVTFADSSEIVKGGVISGFSFGQELAIACTKNGQLYAMANKLPPTGQPATLGKVTDDGKAIVEPLCGTAFDLKTGKPVGKWCPYPLGQLVFGRLIGPSDVAVFKVRQQGGKVQCLINVNAKAQFEQNYWRGVLDSQGKVDGGYY